eukprot:1579199-Alexandrium_andersonii.AAC.1
MTIDSSVQGRAREVASLIGALRLDPDELATKVVAEGGEQSKVEVKDIYRDATQKILEKLVQLVAKPV